MVKLCFQPGGNDSQFWRQLPFVPASNSNVIIDGKAYEITETKQFIVSGGNGNESFVWARIKYVCDDDFLAKINA